MLQAGDVTSIFAVKLRWINVGVLKVRKRNQQSKGFP